MRRLAALCLTTVVAAFPAALAFAAQSPATSTPLDAALALVPKDAVAFVVVPNPKQASDDAQQCIERMNVQGGALVGRPIDQLKALFGVSASFDDKGPIALAIMGTAASAADRSPPRYILSVPTTDATAFIEGNLAKAPEVAPDAYRLASGDVVYAKAGVHHVHLSSDSATLGAYAPGEGIGATVRGSLGARGSALLSKGDIVAWSGRAAIQSAVRTAAEQAAGQMPSDAPFAAQATEWRTAATKLLEGVDSGLLVFELDALGLGIRSFATFAPESELARLTVGGKDREARFDRVPKQPFYFVARADIDGLGGIGALEALLAKLPGTPALPAWLAAAKDSVRAMQLGIFPSKLGLAAGGLLNDSSLFLESERPDAVRDQLKSAILSLKGEQGGLRREPTWEADRSLKSGDVADAFEVTETVVSTKDANPVDLSMVRMLTQAIYGSRGLVGFVKRQQDGVVMTFSQRADVLERTTKTAGGAASLASDATIAAYREWLIDRPDLGRADVEIYVGLGQFGKLIKQVMTLVPGGAQAPVIDIPTSIEPLAFAIEVDKGTVETAAVVPSGALSFAVSGMMTQMMSRPAQPASQQPRQQQQPAGGGR